VRRNTAERYRRRINESTDSSSEKELGVRVRRNRAERYRRRFKTFGESERMLSITKANAPPVSKKKPQSKKTSTKTATTVQSTRVLRKRSTPHHRSDDPAERAAKMQKTTDQMGNKAAAAKRGSPQQPILLGDSDDDTPLKAMCPRTKQLPVVKEESSTTPPKGVSQEPGTRSQGSDWPFRKSNAGASAASAAEDAGLPPSSISPTDQLGRSASQNLGLYQKIVAESKLNANRVAGFESELAKCKLDFEAKTQAIQCENKANLQKLQEDHKDMVEKLRHEHGTIEQQTKRDHETQINEMRKEQAKLQQTLLDLDSQEEVRRQETKTLLDDIQRQSTALESENQSLKDQLSAQKTAHLKLVNTLDQREVFVDSEESFNALKARNLTLSQEVQMLKQRQLDTSCQEVRDRSNPRLDRLLSPTPTLSSSFNTSDETKTTNVRNMFLKVKRRYDNLATVCKKIVDVTMGMDLVGFGEFGNDVKELKKVLQSAHEEDSGGGGARDQRLGERR
jgi:hypothetical protein